MIISDLNHLQAVSEENQIEGGYANASADADAYASGWRYASAHTDTYASASSDWYWRWSPSNYASAGSYSSAYAS